MTPQEDALVQIAEKLESLKVPYVVIGGMANAVWGEPRATLDVDVVVWVNETEIETFPDGLVGSFEILPENPLEFVQETRVLPLQTDSGVRIDLIFGMLPLEQEAVNRGVSRSVAGKTVRFCTAEDLVLFKIVSDRDQDLRDVEAILKRRRATLDRDYLDPRIQELAEGLERQDIWMNYETWIQAD